MTSPLKLTPMLRQYLEIKEQHPDTILFYRMGDFYEMFLEDAVTASRILGITLTSRSHKDDEQKIPMCGVPFHALTGYLSKMVRAGYRVAICEQVEDPKEAKGIVHREVVRIVTPGVTTEEEILDEKANCFVSSLCLRPSGKKAIRLGLAFLDVSTGAFHVNEVDGDSADHGLVLEELSRFRPAELIVPQASAEALQPLTDQLSTLLGSLCLTVRPDHQFDPATARTVLHEHFRTSSLAGFGCDHLDVGVDAAGALLSYIQETQRTDLTHISRLIPVSSGQHLIIDDASRRNLELTETALGGRRDGSLLAVLDRTATPMGARILRERLLFPLQDIHRIRRRLEAIETLLAQGELRRHLAEQLDAIYDMERLCSRLVLGHGNARDMSALKISLGQLPLIKELLSQSDDTLLKEIGRDLDDLQDLHGLIAAAIRDDAPVTIKEGNLICEGYHEELDRLILLLRDGKSMIVGLEAKERERTGLAKLKVGYNRVFGYFFEVSRAQADQVPEDFIRKQTLVNAERFITPELKELENSITTAQERRLTLEYELFIAIRDQVVLQSRRILDSAHHVARLDFLVALAETARTHHYSKPILTEQRLLQITEGRHPVIERALPSGRFVPNDVHLNDHDQQQLIITGPNMAGKSTVLRQTALIVLLAHIGSFVPADRAEICLVDRIFTRVGAMDDLRRGQSTFMVEMNETANILNNATENSLVILDEIGRGTSTYDGLAIARSVAEALAEKNGQGVMTLFATHYHELTDLAATNPRIRNFSIAVREWNETIIFLHKLVEGATNRSYGIQVASLAGVPEPVIQRAKTILREIEEGGSGQVRPALDRQQRKPSQLTLFAPKETPIHRLLKSIDADLITPRQALDHLYELKRLLNESS
jgi:DNA mismatch repair protein MutS